MTPTDTDLSVFEQPRYILLSKPSSDSPPSRLLAVGLPPANSIHGDDSVFNISENESSDSA